MNRKTPFEPDSFQENIWFMRRPVQFFLDVSVLCAAFFLAYLLRFDFEIPEPYLNYAFTQLPFVVLVQVSALFLCGAYSILWRYVSLEDIYIFFKAAFASAILLLLVRLALEPERFVRWQVPVSITLMDTAFAFAGVLGLRVARRLIYELYEKRTFSLARRKIKPKLVLFVGAGRTGSSAVKEVLGRANGTTQVCGFVDDDTHKKGGSVNGIKVLGTTKDLPRLVKELKIERVVIAMDQARGKDVRRIMQLCQEIPVKAQIVPGLHEIIEGQVHVSRIRDVEIEDLLGRDAVQLDTENLREFLGGKIVLVTGAGGSIGSELVRQVAEFAPAKLLLVERAEFNLFQIEREMRGEFAEIQCLPLLADIADAPRMREIFEKFKPEVVFHAAAHKHVPMMETNPCEAIKNNIFATRLIGELAGEHGAKAFVLISTDKAVNPTSIMGASKRIAEIVAQDLESRFGNTRFMAVRFGNVLGSTGSVVPIFREQIQRGEPITVTHPDMTRYFMTIPEAAQLVLQAGAIGNGGEIFILDMGEPVKILDLAEDMIRLSGLMPYDDIDIKFTGIRQGEKLFEELEITGENLLKTKHPKIFIGKIAEYSNAQVETMLRGFRQTVETNNEPELRRFFNEILPEAKITLKKEIGETKPKNIETGGRQTILPPESNESAAKAFAS